MAMNNAPHTASPHGGIDARVAISVLVLLGYWLAGRGVENLYPFSRFPMYSHAAGGAAARVMARMSDGAFVEVTDLGAWHCDALPALDADKCDGVGGIPYIDREREDHIRSHAGDGRTPVELVRRVFSFDGKTRAPYCVISHCTVTR
jgi:hypothetical protein